MNRVLAHRPPALGWILFVVAMVLFLPSILGNDWDSIGTTTAVLVMIAIGLDLVWGLAGQASLGQQGFMLVGAYAVGIATTKWDMGAIASMPVAIAASAVLALIVGLVVLRLHHTYFSLATLGLGLMLPTLVAAYDYFGRSSGLYGIESIPGDLDSTQLYRLYWLIALVLVVFGLRIRHSLTGMSWRVIAENEDLAQSFGVNTVGEKLKAFSIGAGIAGLAGGLYASLVTAISPPAFGLPVLLIVLVGVVVGGLGTVVGAVIGVVALSIIRLYASEYDAWTDFVFAGVFVVALRMMPSGLVPTVERGGRWVRAKVRAWWGSTDDVRAHDGLAVADGVEEA